MKRKTPPDVIADGTQSERKKDKRKRLSIKSSRKKRASTGNMEDKSGSVSSLASSVMSCDSVMSDDEKRRDNILDVTAVFSPRAGPPPVTPRTSSLSRSTTFYKRPMLPLSLVQVSEEDAATPTNSPLPPPPPHTKALDSHTAALPLPPPLAGRGYTVSVALPGSICDNAQSPQLRSYLAGQIARALAIFNVDEVVIFNDNPGVKVKGGVFEGVTKKTNANIVLARILQYLETPQYLRKALFPHHPDLKFAGLLNPLDCPHHMRRDEQYPFREGVVLKRPTKKGKGCFVDCGIDKEVQIDKELTPGMRVTVKMDDYEGIKHYKGTAVSPDAPRQELGTYWGYRVRVADSFSATFTECSYKGGYDLTVGTSDKGDPVDDVNIRHFRHVLVFLGGLQGLEPAIESDESLKETDPRTLFDYYLNTCPNQGSRTIRTEEALMITLTGLRKQLSDNGMD
ncbi:putative methyltransferase C9orf114 [Bolinopsis microptera]|uniref:putative methyltransferase C9orf114 n=1 Tax=Bolinopsis microptera TaxID=2820187 RepID=UPI00307A452B